MCDTARRNTIKGKACSGEHTLVRSSTQSVAREVCTLHSVVRVVCTLHIALRVMFTLHSVVRGKMC